MDEHVRTSARWGDLVDADPDIAESGAERLHGRVAYLATVRGNGSPRLHPVTPVLCGRGLFVFVTAGSPKANDLLRDPRYALHCSVSDTTGSSGEFSVIGQACPINDPAVRRGLVNAADFADEGTLLFELRIATAMLTTYDRGLPQHRRWRPR